MANEKMIHEETGKLKRDISQVMEYNNGTIEIKNHCFINREQFKEFAKRGIIKKLKHSVIFDHEEFRVQARRIQFVVDYQMALQCIKETGKWPNGKTPPKECNILEEIAKWGSQNPF